MELTNQKYRVSEVGIIPVDWEVMHLGDIANVIGGGTPSTFNDDYWNGDINWFTPTEIGLKKYTFESIRKITKKGLENSSARVLPIGTILLTSRAGIGDVSILMNEACTNQGFQSLVAKEELNNEFLYYVVSTLKKVLLQNSSGSTFLEISPKKVKLIQVALPSTLIEQTAIATALSDTDALIENLENLIAKKRNIKQGAMQELLTGRKRLTGFNGKLIEIKLDEVAEIFKGRGLSKTKLQPEGEKPCILYGELFTTYNRIIYNVKSKTNIDEGELSIAGDVLIPGSTTTTGIDLAIASTILQNSVLLGGDIIIIRPNNKYIDSIFLSYYLTEVMKYKISELTQGITIIHLYGKDLRTLKITLPPIEEQSEIANLFKEIDTEIEMVQQKLTKYRMIKQGMMQLLLTGKIRLL